MRSSELAPQPGVPLGKTVELNGNKPATVLTSASVATISGSGTPGRETKAPSTPSSGKVASPLPDRPSKKEMTRARTTIAISLETIDSQLAKLDSPGRILALVEIIRRATKRLETEGCKIIESLEEFEREL